MQELGRGVPLQVHVKLLAGVVVPAKQPLPLRHRGTEEGIGQASPVLQVAFFFQERENVLCGLPVGLALPVVLEHVYEEIVRVSHEELPADAASQGVAVLPFLPSAQPLVGGRGGAAPMMRAALVI